MATSIFQKWLQLIEDGNTIVDLVIDGGSGAVST